MKCEDCIHYNVCYKKPIHENGEDLVAMGGCSDFQDKSLFVEQKHGEWKTIRYKGFAIGGPIWRCSICGCIFGSNDTESKYTYCPHCGAKMDGKDEK